MTTTKKTVSMFNQSQHILVQSNSEIRCVYVLVTVATAYVSLSSVECIGYNRFLWRAKINVLARLCIWYKCRIYSYHYSIYWPKKTASRVDLLWMYGFSSVWLFYSILIECGIPIHVCHLIYYKHVCYTYTEFVWTRRAYCNKLYWIRSKLKPVAKRMANETLWLEMQII